MKQGTATTFNYATIDENGIAPDSRIPTADDAYHICDQLKRDNATREHRWSRIYKCYKRFPPNEYSELAKKQLFGLSNVPFGQMTFEINDKKSAYVDLVTDRTMACDIRTSIGNDKERMEFSEKISLAWDAALWEWDEYFYNFEQDLEEMLLYGKGIEIKIDKATWFTKSYHNSEVLIPNRTKANLTNLSEIAIKDSYTPLEFWQAFKGSKDNKDLGWNFWACLDVLRHHTQSGDEKMTPTQYLQQIDAGNVNFNRCNDRTINVYILLVKEWNGGISKYVILQNYVPLVAGKRGMTEQKYRQQTGYLYIEKGFAEDWKDVIVAFHGAAGSGLWHSIKGHGEDIFPAARQYDITMNKVIDGVNMEMMVPIKGGSADMTRKLKKMEWGRMFVLPEDVDFAQKQFQLPISDAIAATQNIMQDTYRGLSQYNQVKRGRVQTARESELNFAQEAKMDGTALRRYNICMTRWQKLLYKNFVRAKKGWEGYDIFAKFKKTLLEQGVPEEAWQPSNLVQFNSIMLPGAGSPANKFIASQQVAQIAGAMAITEGQEEAYRDAIAALYGRPNVDRYRPRKKPDLGDQERVIAFENGILNNPDANPENAKVHPTDNHLEHFRGHYSDAMIVLDKAVQKLQEGSLDKKRGKETVAILMLKGGHMVAHINYLASDETKQDIVRKLGEAMAKLQERTDEFIGIVEEMPEEQQGEQFDPDIKKLEMEIAKKQIELEAQIKKDQLKLAAMAERHEQRMEIDKEKAATAIGIEIAKANLEAENNERKSKLSKPDFAPSEEE